MGKWPLICAVGIACGGGKAQPREVMPDMRDPAWATDYERRATEGCACGDAACLDRTHGELSALLAKHGGIDDAPPIVHAAHGKFDRCWRDGTHDLERDLEHAAQRVCTCTTSECLRLAKIELAGLVDGKYRENLEAELQAHPKAAAATARAAACLEKVTMPAADALAMMDQLTGAMCTCTDFACVQAVFKQRVSAMGHYLEIDPAVDADQVRDFTTRFCGCMEKAAADAVKSMSPVPSLTRVDVSLSCS